MVASVREGECGVQLITPASVGRGAVRSPKPAGKERCTEMIDWLGSSTVEHYRMDNDSRSTRDLATGSTALR